LWIRQKIQALPRRIELKVFVINAPFYHERRSFQMRQAQRLGLEFEFIDGFDAQKLSDTDAQKAANFWTRPIVKKDVACFYSHRDALKRVIESGDLALILEDDAVLADQLGAVLQAIRTRPADWRNAYDLEYVPKRHLLARTPEWQSDDGSITATRIYQNKIGLAAYVVSPKAAARILAERQEYAMIDTYFWTRSWLNPLQIEPAPAVQMVFLPDAVKSSAVSAPLPKFMNQKLWARQGQRLANRFSDASRFVAGTLFGQSRMLRWNAEGFPRAAELPF
jgi:GR25 family glycosyltransferase involved in LPS biosynthesis